MGWAEGLREWLGSGGPWRPARHGCRRCGQVYTAGSVAYLGRPAGWWSLPVRLAGVVRRRRAILPAPAIYLVAAATGVVLGGVAQMVVAGPGGWWPPPCGCCSSPLRSGAGEGAGRWPPTCCERSTRLGMRREHLAMAERFRAAPFPLYGLPGSWAGSRYLGGSGSHQARGSGRS